MDVEECVIDESTCQAGAQVEKKESGIDKGTAIMIAVLFVLIATPIVVFIIMSPKISATVTIYANGTGTICITNSGRQNAILKYVVLEYDGVRRYASILEYSGFTFDSSLGAVVVPPMSSGCVRIRVDDLPEPGNNVTVYLIFDMLRVKEQAEIMSEGKR